MEGSQKKDCRYAGHFYTHGAEVQIAEKVMVCEDGRWIARSHLNLSNKPARGNRK